MEEQTIGGRANRCASENMFALKYMAFVLATPWHLPALLLPSPRLTIFLFNSKYVPLYFTLNSRSDT